MNCLRVALLASVAGFAWSAEVDAAELPAKSIKPVEYVRVCNAYGAGFFYIPGTDTCIRLSGRARFEYATQSSYSRSGGVGDYSSYRSLLRINIDARTQTNYGALRAFLRLEAASRTGGALHSATANRIANAFSATSADGVFRLQNYIATDKAFIQFAGITAGRASSFFDFYAHDFELIGATAGSDMGSTNLLAYTASLGNGFSTTLSLEDPTFRRTPVYAAQGIVTTSSGSQVVLTPVFAGYTTNGDPSGVGFVDVVQRNRMPDFVGTLRYDATWGSAQLSGAVHEVNTGGPSLTNFAGTNLGTDVSATNVRTVTAPRSTYGWAFQGGVKVNLPFIATGDAFYLQVGYADGAQLYSGYSNFSGSYASTPIAVQGSAFNLMFNDAVLNPFTSQLETSTSFTAVASILHYWAPEWRSALYGSYGELTYAQGSRAAQGAFSNLLGTGPGAVGTRYYQTSAILRDSYQFIAGTSLIWSPVKDLDIGLEGLYTVFGPQSGRILDTSKFPLQNMAYVNNLANPISTRSSQDAIHVRARIQRDF